MRKLLFLSAALLASTALSGCDAVNAISGGDRAVGTYELRAVNGSRVPTLYYQEAGYRLDVLSGSLTLDRDGTYSEALIFRETQSGSIRTTSDQTYGYYEYRNGELVLEESGGSRYFGRLDGNTLQIDEGGVSMVYERY